MVMVLDASVVIKLFVDEPLSELAESINERYDYFLVPDLVRIEVASGITRKVRKRELSIATAYETLQEWRKFLSTGRVHIIPTEEILKNAEKFSIELRHPLKDCLYLAAATQHKVPLVTADQPFIDSLDARFPGVKHLSSFIS